MTIEFTVFKGSANDGILQSKTYRDGPTSTQVLVKITHSGICGSDEHFKHADMVLGHEGVGTVEQVGEKVSQFKVGDIVGWGLLHKACGHCEQCEVGHDQYCANVEHYGAHNLDQGSFGSHAIWDASFLFKVPESMAPEDAAPLMCGGATVYNIIASYNIRPTDRVGVVGIGGLGHLAIQFLAKMGASVIVFSSTESKRDEAMRLGATEFYATKGVESFNMGAKLDHLLITTAALPEWNLFMPVMKPRGKIYPLSMPSGSGMINLPFAPMFFGGLTVQASLVAARSVQRNMLDFAARHEIKPIIERFPLTKAGVEEGMEKLRAGKMRYRGVLVMEE
ncbi:putative NADP-dependent alcohol dehydrogenase C 2 [Mycena albidolilacea]|uniref:NADP-dependent alcohol dehydrogenase C 2 n=1 Tax=Mycena albidolilacea TaxID=1033008 RepID=A0AAD7ABK2_9AGAR|nr:putative NADP-dependent alcohol dehydrogenase C 2 [Mycena albidolilacea]